MVLFLGEPEDDRRPIWNDNIRQQRPQAILSNSYISLMVGGLDESGLILYRGLGSATGIGAKLCGSFELDNPAADLCAGVIKASHDNGDSQHHDAGLAELSLLNILA